MNKRGVFGIGETWVLAVLAGSVLFGAAWYGEKSGWAGDRTRSGVVYSACDHQAVNGPVTAVNNPRTGC